MVSIIPRVDLLGNTVVDWICKLSYFRLDTLTLGAGVLSTVERLSLSRRFANKPRPSILRSLIAIEGRGLQRFYARYVQNGHNTKRID